MKLIALAAPIAVAAALLAGCGGGEADQASPAPTSPAGTSTNDEREGKALADPRDDGFEVALGEWAVTPEAEAIRPGRATFVITNRGEVPHGFEIEREDVEADESKVETRVLQPGETVEVELKLDAGVYKLECNVEGHDDMGMEMLLEVSADAPLEASPPAALREDAVAIEGFAFAPATITTRVGEEVRWTNHDPADHTVTGRVVVPGTALVDHLRPAGRVPLHLRAPPGYEGEGGRPAVGTRTFDRSGPVGQTVG